MAGMANGNEHTTTIHFVNMNSTLAKYESNGRQMWILYCDRMSIYVLSYQNAPMMGLWVHISYNMYMDIFENDISHEMLLDGPWWIVSPQNRPKSPEIAPIRQVGSVYTRGKCHVAWYTVSYMGGMANGNENTKTTHCVNIHSILAKYEWSGRQMWVLYCGRMYRYELS